MRIKLLLSVFLLFCVCIVGNAQDIVVSGKIVGGDGQPIGSCNISIVSLQDSLNRTFSVSDDYGLFSIGNLTIGNYKMEISCVGYVTHINNVSLVESTDFGLITLEEEITQLDEIIITESMVKRYGDRKEYMLTQSEKGQYSSALAALDFIPQIQVIDHDVYSADGKAVKILINGIPSTPIELSVVSPDEISKINYYTQPPIQYANMGLGAVVDVVTKERRDGGSVGLNTQNAVTTGFGNNVINFKYNRENSQIGVTYNINYRNYDKRILDENIGYVVGGKEYKKQKIGENSPYAYEQQMAEISFSNSKEEDYVFSTKLMIKSLDRRRLSSQKIISFIDSVEYKKSGESSDKDNYISPVLDVYFNKMFNAKHEMIINVVGTYYKSGYSYYYSEMCGESQDFVTSTTIDADKFSFIGESLYNYNMQNMQLYMGCRYKYDNDIQKNKLKNDKILTNEIYTYAGLSRMFLESFNYSVSAGINNNIFTTCDNKKYVFAYFRPQVSLGYFIDQYSDLVFDYEVNTINPSVSSMTYNPYYKDINYMYVGNPDLKPSNNHALSLSYFMGLRKYVVNAKINYEYTKDAIAPVFKTDDTNIIETFGNLDKTHDLKASLMLQWSPFSNNLLRLRLYSEVSHQINELDGLEWNHTGYLIMPSVFLNFKKCGFQIFYQTKKAQLLGQTIKTNPSMLYVEFSYKPIKNLTITGGIRYPFYDSWKQTTSVYGTSLLYRTETERIINNANMVYINLVYNFAFGKNKSDINPKMRNEDKDSGILVR